LSAARPPAVLSIEAKSRPAMSRFATPTLKKEVNFSWCSTSLRAAVVDFGRQLEHHNRVTIEREQAGKQARPRSLRRRLEREHLHMPLSYP